MRAVLLRHFVRSVIIATLVTGACGGAPPAASPGSGELSGRLTVFAAASLTEAFNALSKEFTARHPGVAVIPNYGGSSGLVAQLVQGAEADVFASADEANMRKLIDAKLSAGEPRILAHNRLQIVVRSGNPKGITGIRDLARPDVVVILGAPSVPVGAYAQQTFDRAGVKVTPKSLETDVKLVVAKVGLGEADAGIVYSTDVKAGGARIEGIAISDDLNVVARYPITVVRGARNEAAATAFVEFVLSAKGRDVLASFGFIAP